MRFNFVVLIVAMMLSSCSKVEQSEHLSPNKMFSSDSSGRQLMSKMPNEFKRQSYYLKALRKWKITGAIAVREGNQGWQARMIWRESPGNFSGRFYAYFSPEQVVIKGNSSQVTLIDEKGHVYKERTVESMIKKSTGWTIPMDYMRYWIRGLYVPGVQHQVSFDADSRINTLEQSGWRLQFKEYMTLSGYVLPKKIEISKGNLRVRLAVNKWSI